MLTSNINDRLQVPSSSEGRGGHATHRRHLRRPSVDFRNKADLAALASGRFAPNSGHSPISAPNLAAPIASNRFFSSTGPGVSLMAESEHSVRVGARNVRRDHWYRVFRVANELQGVPMFDGLAVGVHLVDVDAGDPRILRVVIEEIQKVDVRPYIVAGGDDAVDDDAGPGAFPRNLCEEFP